MPVLYKAIQSQFENKEKKRPFYPRVVITGKVDTDQIAREIAEYSSLTPGDVKNVIDNLVTVMTKHLQSSESVSLDGLGSFRPTLLATKTGFDTAEEVSPSVSTLTVRFTPATTRHPDGTVATRSMATGAVFARFEPATEAEVDDTEDEEESGEAPDPIV